MKIKVLLGLAILLFLLFWAATSIYPDWLWFKNLGFAPVFSTMLASRFGFGMVIWVFLALTLTVNFLFAGRFSRRAVQSSPAKAPGGEVPLFGLSGRALNTLLLAFIIILTFVIASKGSRSWDTVLRFIYQQPFDIADPIFGRDVGFYTFSLPFYTLLRDGLMIFFVLTALITIIWYLKNGALQITGDFTQSDGVPTSLPKITVSQEVKKHLSFLGGIIVLLMAWGFYLKVFALLYSTQGPAFGASYTDVHVKIFAYRAIMVLSAAFAVVLFISAFNFRKKFLWISAGAWVVAILILGTLAPMVVQKFVVKPNELAKESEYMKNNIVFTRSAYNLNKIQEVDFQVNDTLTAADLSGQEVTLQNIRIWDERPLLQTYKQIQSIRLYYDFHNVDVDRYRINGQLRQVMLAARELVVDHLPPQADTWVNRHLTYTHGYGLAMSPVNEVTREGLPHLLIKDLPPAFEVGLEVDRPEIYYGEKTDEYVLVKTKAQEFDYPKGDKNVYTRYQGRGGVPLNSFVRKMLFAIEFMDPQIFFTTYLGPESRILYKRRIHRRVALIAPFLDYDADPYLVVSEGKLYWIIDAYTTSSMYPYSKRSRGPNNKTINYIRNSVKVTVDAYNGDVSFYVIDDKDPFVRTYTSIFPNLFKPFKDMPKGLKTHIRYPKDLFKIQAENYTTYHMEDIQVFYNQEDLWQTPDELYGDARQKMEPYFIIIKLPESHMEEFVLMLPFTPSKKDNMIGWLAARSDLDDYGSLLVYKLPKDKLVYGPMQIEARVDQQTEISRELSLWGQRGSRVIRGNLLAIPISNSFLYVEPIYLEATQEKPESTPQTAQKPSVFGKSQQGQSRTGVDTSKTAALPELKRVIVALGNRVVMEKTLDKALASVLDVEVRAIASAASPLEAAEASNLAEAALSRYHSAKQHLREGNWAAYGKDLERLEQILKRMNQ
ncbi:MAG: UPF0182 family protein [Deltaproteobacteria bacterium]|nr:UPF0182 family protein [Deltaproteobacteria bacterium]